METDTDSTLCMEGFPDSYIVLCRNFSTSTDSDSCTEIFPDGYCTHFGTDLHPRDLNPSPLVEMSHKGDLTRNIWGKGLGSIFSCTGKILPILGQMMHVCMQVVRRSKGGSFLECCIPICTNSVPVGLW